jgi:hypothetical protein
MLERNAGEGLLYECQAWLLGLKEVGGVGSGRIVLRSAPMKLPKAGQRS